jgi:hypothetical protein
MKVRLGLMLLALAAVGADRPPEAAEKVVIQAGKDSVDFIVGRQLLGRYHLGPNVAKPYFWPLTDPYGVPITRGWPMVPAQQGESKDHVHQKSAWFCHGDVIPEGVEVKQKIKGIKGIDFWSEARGHGRIVCTRALIRVYPQTDTRGLLQTDNEWRTADGVTILKERRKIYLYVFGATRLLVFDIDLHASEVPVTFGDTKEGSMGVRVNDSIREKGGNGKLVNADGKTGMAECWGQRSAWCDYSGTINGKAAGIAIFDHPKNPYPACWHSRDYGLMAANPFGRAKSGFPAERGNTELVRLAKGGRLKLRYGILIHPGDVKGGKVADFYQRYLKLKK